MKNFICAFLLIVSFNLIIAQSGIKNTLYPTVNRVITITKINKYNCYEGQTSVSYTDAYDYDAGDNTSQSINPDGDGCYDRYNYYRNSLFKIDYSFPANAANKKVMLSAYAVSGSNGMIVSLSPQASGYSYSDLWQAIEGGSNLFSYNAQQGWYDITTFALQSSQYGYFLVGANSNTGHHNITITCKIEYDTPFNISFANNMGGQITLNGANRDSGYSDDFWLNDNITLMVDEPKYTSNPDYTWIWNDTEAPASPSTWTRIKNGYDIWKSNAQSYNFSVVADDHNSTYKANMRKLCNTAVSSSNYPIYINGQAYYSSANLQVVEYNSVSLQCDPIFSQNGQMQFFSNWNCNGQSSSGNINITESPTIIIAVYSNRPVYNGYKQVFFGQAVGQPIEVYWTENPNTQITEYEIWRRVKSNGVLGPEAKIATVGRGVQLHTDYTYNLTDGYTDKIVYYDVREHNTVTGGYSSPAYEAVYGTLGDLSKKAIKDQIASNEAPTEFGISNYPNPFNPTTTINYQLPKDGMVTIKVYDIIGKEVATLINGHKSAGYYKVDFDASKLTSGVYICSIQASDFSKSIKLLLTK